MTQYTNAKIYKIVDNTNNNVYYGSTTKPLKIRLQCHQSGYKQFLKGNRFFMTSFIILKNDNYSIHLVENYPCNNNEELQLREKFYIKNNDCINHLMSGKTNKPYYAEWSDLIKDAYRRLERRRNHKHDCVCGGKYTHKHKSEHDKTKKHVTFTLNLNLTVSMNQNPSS